MFNDTTHARADHHLRNNSTLHPPDDTLRDRFNSYFASVTADTDERIRTAQMIRYQVYCVENPLEDVENPDRIETDMFDPHSVHSLLVYRAAGAALGTVRLIMPLPDDLEQSLAFLRVVSNAAP